FQHGRAWADDVHAVTLVSQNVGNTGHGTPPEGKRKDGTIAGAGGGTNIGCDTCKLSKHGHLKQESSLFRNVFSRALALHFTDSAQTHLHKRVTSPDNGQCTARSLLL